MVNVVAMAATVKAVPAVPPFQRFRLSLSVEASGLSRSLSSVARSISGGWEAHAARFWYSGGHSGLGHSVCQDYS